MPHSCSLAGRAYSNATRAWESLISTLTRAKRVGTRHPWADIVLAFEFFKIVTDLSQSDFLSAHLRLDREGTPIEYCKGKPSAMKKRCVFLCVLWSVWTDYRHLWSCRPKCLSLKGSWTIILKPQCNFCAPLSKSSFVLIVTPDI